MIMSLTLKFAHILLFSHKTSFFSLPIQTLHISQDPDQVQVTTWKLSG